MDSAKIILILCKNGGICRDYKFHYVVTNHTFPLIAIPTTASTGSEATAVCVISDSGTDEKMLMMGPSFMPSTAIIDYSLTMSLPARITVYTGIDALLLGGAKNNLLLLPDTDVDITAADIVASFIGCTGQRCMAASLLMAVGDTQDTIDKVVEESKKIVAGQNLGAIITKESKR